MKRKIASALLLVIGCLILFRDSLAHYFIEQQISSYASHYLDITLSDEGKQWVGHRLTISHLKDLHHQKFKAERLTLNYEFDFWRRELKISIDVEKPFFHLGLAEPQKLKALSTGSFSWPLLLKIVPDVTIQRAKMSWASPFDYDPHLAHFDLKYHDSLGFQLNAKMKNPVWPDRELSISPLTLPDHVKEVLTFSSSPNFFHLTTGRNHEGVNMRVDVCSCHSKSVVTLLSHAIPELGDLRVFKGSFQGNLNVFIPNKGRPFLEGSILMRDWNWNFKSDLLKGGVKSARLTFNKNPSDQNHEQSVLSTIGRLEFFEPNQFEYTLPNQTTAQVSNLTGKIELLEQDRLHIDFETDLAYTNSKTHYHLNLDTFLTKQQLLGVDFLLKCQTVGRPEAIIDVKFTKKPTSEALLEAKVSDLTPHEGNFLQALISHVWSGASALEVDTGTLNGLLKAQISKQGLEKIHFENVSLTHFKGHTPTSGIHFGCQSLKGKGVLYIDQTILWKDSDLELHLEEGTLSLGQLPSPLLCSNIFYDITINKGMIPHSKVLFELKGLRGALDIELTHDKELLTLKLDGKGADLRGLLPKQMQKEILLQIENDQIGVAANITRHSDYFDLTGTIRIQDRQNAQPVDLIHFGCECRKNKDVALAEWIPKGWFHARQLRLEKYLSPLLFRNGVLKMSGVGEFKGSFESHLFLIKYDADDLRIQNKNLVFEVPHLHSTQPGQLIGWHEFDLSTGRNHGELPLQHAVYHENNSKLLFEEICGIAHFKDKTLKIKNLETYCEGLYFKGELGLDYADPRPGVFSVTMNTPCFSGKVSHVQRLLSHLDKPPLLANVPIEGEINSRNDGLTVRFDFLPKDFEVYATVSGSVYDGTFTWESRDLSLKSLYMDIDYDHGQQLLEFQDIQGLLLVGKPKNVKELLFSAARVAFVGPEQDEVKVDLSVSDGNDELARFAATSESLPSGMKKIVVDTKLSHFSAIHPSQFRLFLKGWNHVEEFSMSSSFDIGSLFNDLVRFSETGFFGIQPHLMKKTLLLESSTGLADLQIKYDSNSKMYQYLIESPAFLTKEGGKSHRFSLKGRKDEKKWFLDLLEWDHFTLLAELQDLEDKVRVNFLGLNDGRSTVLGLEGDLFLDQAVFDAKINMCEIDLSHLNQWDSLQEMVGSWNPQGVIKASGKLKLSLLKNLPWYSLEGALVAEPGLFVIHQIPMDLKKGFEFKALPDKEFMIVMKEGVYTLKGEDYHLSNLKLSKKDAWISLKTNSIYERCPFQLGLTTKWPDCEEGQLTLLDTRSDLKNPLAIRWHRSNAMKFFIDSMEGEFSGLKVHMNQFGDSFEEGEDWSGLKGELTINVEKIKPLLEETTLQALTDLRLNSTLLLNGTLLLNPFAEGSIAEMLFFDGTCYSGGFFLKGYQFQNLSANCSYSPKRLEVKQLTVEDPSGTLYADKSLVWKESEGWRFQVPDIQCRNFRPALLREQGMRYSNGKMKSLLVKRLSVTELTGSFKDSSTWEGSGYLHFVNPPTKNIFYPLFVVPGEILSHLGLDPRVLNPVTGTLNYTIQDQKIYINRLKDVYSEGRASKFYLVDGVPGTVDFDGNLSLQIKMRQSSLLFKIAEMFTVSVNGDIKNPKFSLKKQSRIDHRSR